MSFSKEVKRQMFERCLRLCCICLKPCGSKIYACHIIDESKGGPDTFDNGIPLCHDHHHEIGHYRDDHPLGNKWQPKELKNRRDKVYGMVDSGAMYAMMLSAQLAGHGDVAKITADELVKPKKSNDANEFVGLILKGNQVLGRGGKLKLFDEAQRSLILDALVEKASEKTIAESLMQLTKSQILSTDEKRVIAERTVRRVALYGNEYAKAAVLKTIDPDVFAECPEELRAAFFEDAIESAKEDQFTVVNELVPSFQRHMAAVPKSLRAEFVKMLFGQATSSGYNSAPAARDMLKDLPDGLAKAGMLSIDRKYLVSNGWNKPMKAFIEKYAVRTKGETKKLVDEFLKLGSSGFEDKYSGK